MPWDPLKGVLDKFTVQSIWPLLGGLGSAAAVLIAGVMKNGIANIPIVAAVVTGVCVAAAMFAWSCYSKNVPMFTCMFGSVGRAAADGASQIVGGVVNNLPVVGDFTKYTTFGTDATGTAMAVARYTTPVGLGYNVVTAIANPKKFDKCNKMKHGWNRFTCGAGTFFGG